MYVGLRNILDICLRDAKYCVSTENLFVSLDTLVNSTSVSETQNIASLRRKIFWFLRPHWFGLPICQPVTCHLKVLTNNHHSAFPIRLSPQK